MYSQSVSGNNANDIIRLEINSNHRLNYDKFSDNKYMLMNQYVCMYVYIR